MIHPDVKPVDDPILRQKSSNADLSNIKDAQKIMQKMQSILEDVATKHNYSGAYGMSAIQIGVPQSICLIHTPTRGWIPIINPVMTKGNNRSEPGWESCLNNFDKRGYVERPVSITIDYHAFDTKLEQFTKRSERFRGQEARLIYQQLDHMNGVLYTDHINNPRFIVDYSEYAEYRKDNRLKELVKKINIQSSDSLYK